MPKKRKNGSSEFDAAAQASEEFHGTEAHEVIEVKTKIFEHENLADCGELRKLEIIGLDGEIVSLSKFKGARLAMSPKGYPAQLFIEGGDQEVSLEDFGISRPHEIEVLGHLKFITYYTVKHHLGKDGGEANYRHRFNDNGGMQMFVTTKKKNRPTVVYDTMNKLITLAGGEYEILPEGIDN